MKITENVLKSIDSIIVLKNNEKLSIDRFFKHPGFMLYFIT